jgi:hypothetical protein
MIRAGRWPRQPRTAVHPNPVNLVKGLQALRQRVRHNECHVGLPPVDLRAICRANRRTSSLCAWPFTGSSRRFDRSGRPPVGRTIEISSAFKLQPVKTKLSYYVAQSSQSLEEADMFRIILGLMLLAMPAAARDHGQWGNRQWFQRLMQPDNPVMSCCGEADAFEADSFENSGDHYVAIIQTERGSSPKGPASRCLTIK